MSTQDFDDRIRRHMAESRPPQPTRHEELATLARSKVPGFRSVLPQIRSLCDRTFPEIRHLPGNSVVVEPRPKGLFGKKEFVHVDAWILAAGRQSVYASLNEGGSHWNEWQQHDAWLKLSRSGNLSVAWAMPDEDIAESLSYVDSFVPERVLEDVTEALAKLVAQARLGR